MNFPRLIKGFPCCTGIVGIFEKDEFSLGFPAMSRQVLSQQGLDLGRYYGYLVLYNLAYIADDAIMATIAVITLCQHKLQE